MKKSPSKFCDPTIEKPARRRAGFTLVEVILVLVVIVIISGISVPYFAGSYRGTKLRSSARTISRMARYSRSMAIMREETFTLVLNHETMEVFLGATPSREESSADGELDQDVLKRLGYIDDEDGGAGSTAGIDKEVHRFLPEGLTVREFNKNWTDDDDEFLDLYIIRFYPNGQCEWFELELEDNRGMGVRLENDPISGKIISEFIQ